MRIEETTDDVLELNEDTIAILDVAHANECRDLERLTEASPQIVGHYKVKKELKIKRMVARTANLIAKQAGDVMYQKFLFHWLKAKTYRAAIQKKYGMKAKQQVRIYLTRKRSPLTK